MGQGSHDDKNNYRPITVLPILSKLFEKHICDHLYDFLEENALRHHLQSRFLKFHSTETALIRLIDQLVFIDYRKAFDLKDHDLLLTKLNASGICGRELDLLRNYLSERKQYVVIDGCRSPQELWRLEYHKGAYWALLCFSCSSTTYPCQLSVQPLTSMRVTSLSVSHPTWQMDFLALHQPFNKT